MAGVVKFKRIYVDADDDSFYAWIIVDRLPYDVFLACKKAKAVWYVDLSEYGRRGFWEWDVLKAADVLKKFGYEVDEESLRVAKKEEERIRMAREMTEIASKITITCPKCGEKLNFGVWNSKSAAFTCHSCRWSAVINRDGKIVVQGFDEDFKEFEKEMGGKYWTYVVMDAIEDPEKFNEWLWKREKKKILEEAYEKIEEIARKTGEKPDRWVDFPEGEVLEDTEYRPNIYGAGVWYIIQENCIWIIHNNGSDGADWSLNNVRTGGAGAIGIRCPRTEQLEALVRFRGKENRTDEDFRAVLKYL
jgi:hypothetical protein